MTHKGMSKKRKEHMKMTMDIFDDTSSCSFLLNKIFIWIFLFMVQEMN